MKRILVPTDFSACAGFAADYAIEIATKTGASVTFFTQIPLHPFWASLTKKEKTDFPESYTSLYNLKEYYAIWQDRYQSSGVSLSFRYAPGKMSTLIQDQVSQEKVDLIVMGSRGADGPEEFFFGSNAQKVVRHSPCPVMVVKQPLGDKNINHITFASDFQPEVLPSFENLVDFARLFGSHINLLNIIPYPQFEAPEAVPFPHLNPFIKCCEGISYSVSKYLDQNVEAGIRHFALKENTDIVALAHGSRSLLDRMSAHSITEALANHLDIPLLAFPIT